MDDILFEIETGRCGAGPAPLPITSSKEKPWNGYFIRKCGPTNVSVSNVILLKQAITLQLEQPASHTVNCAEGPVVHTVQPGQTSIFPANALYSGSFAHEGSHIAVFFDPRFLGEVAASQTRGDSIELCCQYGVDSAPLRELILMLQAESESPDPTDPRAAEAIARLIAIHLVQHYSNARTCAAKSGGLSPMRLKRVLSFLQQSPLDELTLEKIAPVSGLSVFHFSRVFRQSTGLSPLQYVMNRRINRARELLVLPSARINEVALECGFCDQAHLTRHFKRLTGTTPAAFARSAALRNNQ